MSTDPKKLTADRTQLLESLGFFKDWTNYLLVTTVAALGWVSTNKPIAPGIYLQLTIAFLCVSIIFAISTLALVPIVGERIEDNESIYQVEAPFRLFWTKGNIHHAKLKHFCWPQHISFLAAIITFSSASISAAAG